MVSQLGCLQVWVPKTPALASTAKIYYLTQLKVMGDSPNGGSIMSSRVFLSLFSLPQCHFIRTVTTAGSAITSSYGRRLFPFLCPILLVRKTFPQRPLATFCSHFIGQNWDLCPPHINSLQGECNHHCWLRLIRICPSYNREDEKMSEPHQGSGL